MCSQFFNPGWIKIYIYIGYTHHYLPYLSSSIYSSVYSGGVITSLTHHWTSPLILVFILPSIYSFISFSLPAYLHLLNSLPLYILHYPLTCFTQLAYIYILPYPLTCFTQLVFIYSPSLTYSVSSTPLYIFHVTCTSLTYLQFNLSYSTYPIWHYLPYFYPPYPLLYYIQHYLPLPITLLLS